MATINEFKSRMTGGGLRQNQFRVILPTIPNTINFDTKTFTILCKATTLPESNIADVPVSYRGKKAHFAGEKEFSSWTVTVYTDTDFDVRDAFESWSSMISNYSTTEGETNIYNYQVDGKIQPLSRGGKVLKTYDMKGIWVRRVGEIQMDYDTENTIASFEVEFVYDYFQPSINSTDNYLI